MIICTPLFIRWDVGPLGFFPARPEKTVLGQLSFVFDISFARVRIAVILTRLPPQFNQKKLLCVFIFNTINIKLKNKCFRASITVSWAVSNLFRGLLTAWVWYWRVVTLVGYWESYRERPPGILPLGPGLSPQHCLMLLMQLFMRKQSMQPVGGWGMCSSWSLGIVSLAGKAWTLGFFFFIWEGNGGPNIESRATPANKPLRF